MFKRLALSALIFIAAVTALIGISACEVGHDFSCQHEYDYTVTKAAGCLEEGERKGVCTKCGYETVGTIPALGHSPQPVGQAEEATCEHTGITEGSKCSRCGTVLSEQTVIPVQSHSYDEGMRCKWCRELKTYTVTFDADNGSEPVVQTFGHGKTVIFPAEPQKADSVFAGWYAGEEEYIDGSIVTADVMLRAKWITRVEIRDAAGLNAIALHPDYNYVLVNDINMRGEELTVIEEFTGVLDGQGHTVRDFLLGSSSNGGAGLIAVNSGTVKNIVFREIGFSVQSVSDTLTNIGVVACVNRGDIQNVTVKDGSFTVNAELNRNSVNLNFGLIAGNNGGNIIGCNVYADVVISLRGTAKRNNNRIIHSFNIGGIAGSNGNKIGDCYFGGSIETYSKAECDEQAAYVLNYYNIGGLTGENAGASAYLSDSYCNVNLIHKTLLVDRGEEYSRMGGVTGINTDGALAAGCYAAGEISAAAENSNTSGGFAALNESNAVIRGCYSTVNAFVSGKKSKTTRIGGFVGQNAATVQKSYSTGNVTADNIANAGAFIGENLSEGTVRFSYCTGLVTVSGNGVAGYFSGSAAGSVYKCYYLSGTVVTVSGEYIVPEQASGNNAAVGKLASELWNEEFLSEELNWDTDDGWLVFADDNPLLSWELGRGHDFKSKVIEPTHEYGGYTAYRCADCGRLFIKDYTGPTGHNYEIIETVAPTCTAQGYDIVRCTKDGCDFEGSEIHINFTGATGHRKGQLLSSETAATCGTDGLGTYSCADCGERFTAEIPADGNHSWIDVAEKQPVECSKTDCGEEGYTAHRLCGVCGAAEGKRVISQHADANKDNVCDRCKGFTFTTVDKSEFIEISDQEGLAAINNGLSGCYILTADIYLDATWTAIGTKASPFTGILYGNGHIISGLTVQASGGEGEIACGLFGYNRGTVIGVTIAYLQLNATNSSVVFGGIAAYNYGRIIDCVLRGDNVLMFTADKKLIADRGSKENYVYTLTAGGFAGVNGAGGVISGCAVEGRFESVNSVHAKIQADVGNTVWSATGALLNSILFDTRLTITQTVTFGGVAGLNSGTVEGCAVTAKVNLYSTADAELLQLKGKTHAYTNLYAGSVIGYNTGSSSANIAESISFDVPDMYSHIGIPYIITGKSYEITYEITNHGKDGDGKIGVDNAR